MSEIVFEMPPDKEYTQLDQLLKLMSWVNSGGEAHHFITEGAVLLNGAVETQKRKKIRAGDRVEFDGKRVRVEG